ncbi:pyrroline-5-carboxylate reductase [Sphingobacterium haloxyli]|uniref:Pyrroline-5-carboxylate reductase n=1 Tax=Sphingobacterium haloxyli TaxID=2100533 RepID=A0A2S9J864_9SPHI|nr:pyrroline-5-carboxylate reductase [Sphingobacterium haloxyli]PRD48937.1 pyrroline-5-carboxylate reductase [Sphingobacterium haloxyli]
MKILVIGAGNMGLTYAQGMAQSDLLKEKDLMILDNSAEKIAELRAEGTFDVYEKLADCLPKADIVFIAVKPYHSDEVFEAIKEHKKPDQIFVSIMAGVTIKTMQEAMGIKKVVRAMPNLAAQVGHGFTSFVGSKEVSRLELLTVEKLIDTTGRSIKLANEMEIDKSTGISGSGPAYVFYFMESMMEAAIKMGFCEKDARLMVAQTFQGAVELFNSSDINPTAWMDRVASKGGTTRAALDSMEENNVKELIKDAAYAAFDRAVQLGKENNKQHA